MKLEKVISGGQTGADIAGVRAAKKLGLATGGTMPRGFWTLKGSRPEYAKEFGMVEDPSPHYPPRTRKNVNDSDGTIRLAVDFNSRGERCTLRFIQELDKPDFMVHIGATNSFKTTAAEAPAEAAQWILDNNIKVLNVAGNAEETAAGMEVWVERYITSMLEQLKLLEGKDAVPASF